MVSKGSAVRLRLHSSIPVIYKKHILYTKIILQTPFNLCQNLLRMDWNRYNKIDFNIYSNFWDTLFTVRNFPGLIFSLWFEIPFTVSSGTREPLVCEGIWWGSKFTVRYKNTIPIYHLTFHNCAALIKLKINYRSRYFLDERLIQTTRLPMFGWKIIGKWVILISCLYRWRVSLLITLIFSNR